MKALKYNPEEIDIEVTDISLLTVEEAERLPENIREYEDWWWLRTPGISSHYAAFVHFDGPVSILGAGVTHVNVGVRPALTISNLEDLGVRVGDTIIIQDKKYVVVSDNKVLYNDDAVYHRFDKDSNDYEKSEIKKIVDGWLN